MTDSKPEQQQVETRLDVDIPLPKTRFLSQLREAHRITGRSKGEIFREIMRLQFSKIRLMDSEYFKYRLYDNKAFTQQQKSEFIGQRQNLKIHKAANVLSRSSGLINNKYYLENFIKGVGLSGTRTLARIADPVFFTPIFGMENIYSKEELRGFLAGEKGYPLFGKPVGSSLSLGTVGIAAFDAKSDQLSLTNGTKMAVSAFFDQIWEAFRDKGYVFQSMIKVHPLLAKYTGKAVGSFRVVTVRKPDKIDVLYTTWKIPSPTSMADNFWRDDNLIAFINTETGIIERCQKGTSVYHELVDHLPGTDLPLTGLQMPEWEKVKQLALNVASQFSDNRILGFDVALAEDGPILIEGNTNPDHGLYQIASGRGFMNSDHRELIEWNMKEATDHLEKQNATSKKKYKSGKKRMFKQRFDDYKADLNQLDK